VVERPGRGARRRRSGRVGFVARSGRTSSGVAATPDDEEHAVNDDGHVWVLSGDEDAVATSDQARAGDVVLRRTRDGADVGEVTGEGTVTWWGEIDPGLLPAGDDLASADERPTPLQRVDGSPQLRTAIDGIRSAFRERGG
jgi:hypothetical protein